MSEFLTPIRASNYLTERGVKRSVGSLSKLRWAGGGPRFHKVNTAVVYCRDDLDRWLVEMLDGSHGNTSEFKARAAQRQAVA